MDIKDKIIVGLTEQVEVKGNNGESMKVIARIDTGATKSSIDLSVASELQLGPVMGSKLVKSAHGSKLRPMLEVTMTIHGQEVKELFTLADRSHMKYRVLIGQNVLKTKFLIDPSQSYEDTKGEE